MLSDAMGRCGNCGGEMTTGGCPKCNSVRVYNYPVSYAPPCAKCVELERDLAAARADAQDSERAAVAFAKQYDAAVAERDAARAEAARLRELFVLMLENYTNDVGDVAIEDDWMDKLEGRV